MGHGAPRILVAPRPPARDPPRPALGARGIPVGRVRVVARAIPVEAPLMADARECGDAERVLWSRGDERRALEPARLGLALSPGEPGVREPAARRLLPFRLGGK